MMRKYRLIRDVTKKECPWLDRTFKEGETVYYYSGYTYGCISFNGIAVCEKLDENPFFELPENALEEI